MTSPEPTPKVSVIVPVYNPGEHIDDCIASILGQSLPDDEYEAIFVDDGSTDGTGARLDALAAEHANVTAIHIENSGWPGRPRNVGMDAARGDYLYFVDNDDWLGDEALERLHASARRTGADVVVGKVVGHRRGAPGELFRRNRDDAKLLGDPLLHLLTPHKLFRAEFVREHGIRFPEGRVRLEDHLFCMPAFFAADVITVVSDYAFYHWVRREDQSNASEGPVERAYWDAMAKVLDIVDANTEPGTFRDRLLAHWYRSKVLARMGGGSFVRRDPQQRRAMFDDVRPVVLERFGGGVLDHLNPPLKVRSALLRAGRFDELTALAEADADVRSDVVLESATWEGRELRLRVRATLVRGDGAPFVVPVVEGRPLYPVPALVEAAPEVTPADRDVSAAIAAGDVRAFVRSKRDWDACMVPTTSDVEQERSDDGVVVTVRAEIRIDPTTAAAGAPLSRAVWDVSTIMRCCGVQVVARLPVSGVALPGPVVLDEGGVAAMPLATKAGYLSVDVDQARDSILDRLSPGREHVTVASEPGRLRVGVALRGLAALGDLEHAGNVLLTAVGGGDARVEAPASLVAGAADPRLEALFAVGDGDVRPGRWRIWAQLGPRRIALPASLDVARNGRAEVVDPRSPLRLPHATRVKRALRRLAAR